MAHCCALMRRRCRQQMFNTIRQLLTGSSPPHRTLQDLFREVADTHREKKAVVFGREQITFGELDAASNQLAHYLTAQGIGKGDLVPVWIPAYLCPGQPTGERKA
jgi:non-ribosomal peptide synthetase component F